MLGSAHDVRMAAEFVPGIELARRLHRDVVGPLLVAEQLGRSAVRGGALLGPGSEVLGFDTDRSTDHDWGPRLQVFLDEPDLGRASELTARIAQRLPPEIAGHATAIALARRPRRAPGWRSPSSVAWLVGRLGVDPRAGFRTSGDWLATPTQALAEITGGAVFHDPNGALAAVRRTLNWYPLDVWRVVLAGHWVARRGGGAVRRPAGEVGDALGSALVTARLVRDLVRLSLLLHRRYPPYSKWLGLGVRPVAVRTDPGARC